MCKLGHTAEPDFALVPIELLEAAIAGLERGGDAILDRDWDLYPEVDLLEAEGYVAHRFRRVESELRRLIDR